MADTPIWRGTPGTPTCKGVTLYGARSALLDGDPLGDVVELFEDAEAFLDDCLVDEPGWADVLEIVETKIAA